MKVIKVYPDSYESNAYIVTKDGNYAVVIDCPHEKALDKCRELKLKVCGVLLTHGHFDHVGGVGAAYESGVPIFCGEREKDFIFSKENLGIFGGVFVPHFEIYKTLSDGEELEFGGIKFKVLHTPGHTAGSVCYIAEDCIFTGDTLFCGSVGRWDLPSGNGAELINSVNKILALEGDKKVYCGHGEDTALQRERESNPYARKG